MKVVVLIQKSMNCIMIVGSKKILVLYIHTQENSMNSNFVFNLKLNNLKQKVNVIILSEYLDSLRRIICIPNSRSKFIC